MPIEVSRDLLPSEGRVPRENWQAPNGSSLHPANWCRAGGRESLQRYWSRSFVIHIAGNLGFIPALGPRPILANLGILQCAEAVVDDPEVLTRSARLAIQRIGAASHQITFNEHVRNHSLRHSRSYDGSIAITSNNCIVSNRYVVANVRNLRPVGVGIRRCVVRNKIVDVAVFDDRLPIDVETVLTGMDIRSSYSEVIVTDTRTHCVATTNLYILEDDPSPAVSAGIASNRKEACTGDPGPANNDTGRVNANAPANVPTIDDRIRRTDV
jgi:hypothetical protein